MVYDWLVLSCAIDTDICHGTNKMKFCLSHYSTTGSAWFARTAEDGAPGDASSSARRSVTE